LLTELLSDLVELNQRVGTRHVIFRLVHQVMLATVDDLLRQQRSHFKFSSWS
jgi:hypothetical protein